MVVALVQRWPVPPALQVCYFPSERYDHEAVYFDDGMMYVYGGYSQRCGDYCDDMWLFDIYTKQWSQVNGSGELSHIQQFEDSHRWGGPGKRWRFTMLQDEKYLGYNGERILSVSVTVFGSMPSYIFPQHKYSSCASFSRKRRTLDSDVVLQWGRKSNSLSAS